MSLSNASGAKQFTLAFIQADSNNQPSWGGDPSMELGSSFDQALQASVSNLRAAGGDVMVSFGGADRHRAGARASVMSTRWSLPISRLLTNTA